jgi:hypothetical protein
MLFIMRLRRGPVERVKAGFRQCASSLPRKLLVGEKAERPDAGRAAHDAGDHQLGTS